LWKERLPDRYRTGCLLQYLSRSLYGGGLRFDSILCPAGCELQGGLSTSVFIDQRCFVGLPAARVCPGHINPLNAGHRQCVAVPNKNIADIALIKPDSLYSSFQHRRK